MRYWLLLALVVVAASCAAQFDVSFSTLMQGIHAQHERGEVVIRDSVAWHRLQEKLVSQVAPYPPAIDFENEMIVAVFYGQVESSGYKIDIDRVTETTHDVVVHVREEVPGNRCVVNGVLTYPYHVIRMKRLGKTVRFVRGKVEMPC